MKVYRSKIGLEILVPIVLNLGVTLYLHIVNEIWIGVFVNSIVAIFIAYFYTGTKYREGKIILLAGIGLLIFVPIFKTLTHLPPFMGMLLALGLMWIITTVIHNGKETGITEKDTVTKALQKVDTPSILFFLGILLAVSALQSFGIIKDMADGLNDTLRNDYLIGLSSGLLSAVVDNVPLVAASQGMYELNTYPTDHHLWEFLELTTGTGGSAIIIGSAAGVAVMGIERIDFMRYLNKVSRLAFIGFIAGIAVFLFATSNRVIGNGNKVSIPVDS